MEDKDTLLHLKKRARRRLVGAVALAATAAFVLNMAMDHQPKQEAQDVEIRIPGQDEKPFAPGFAAVPPAQSAPAPAPEPAPAKPQPPAAKPQTPVPVPPVQAPVKKTPETVVDKPVAKPAAKTPPAPIKPPETAAKPPADDSARAAAILAGKSPEPANHGSQHVILIGAFADPANVKNLQTKLSQLGIKVYTEPLDSPQGKKTRVRAGPFPTREAGEKALEKMKRIGVNGVLTAKQ